MTDLSKYGTPDFISDKVPVYRNHQGYNLAYFTDVKPYLIKDPFEIDKNFYISPGDKIIKWGKPKDNARALKYLQPITYLGYVQGKEYKHIFLTCDHIYCDELIFIDFDILVNLHSGKGVMDIRNLSESEIIRIK